MINTVNKIKNLLRWARVTSAGADDKDYPYQQVSYQGKVGDATIWLPYGFHANIPVDYLAVILSLCGSSEMRVAFPGSPHQRPKPIAAGEIVIYHPLTGAKVHFKANGDIDIDTPAKLNVTAATETNVTAPIVNVVSDDINLGNGVFQKLLNETALATYNGHDHGGSPPTQQMVIGTDTTIDTEAS